MAVQTVEVVRCDRCNGKMDGPTRYVTPTPEPKLRVLVLHQAVMHPVEGDGESHLGPEELRVAAQYVDLCDKCNVLTLRLIAKIAGTHKPKTRKPRAKKAAEGGAPVKRKGRTVGGTKDVARVASDEPVPQADDQTPNEEASVS